MALNKFHLKSLLVVIATSVTVKGFTIQTNTRSTPFGINTPNKNINNPTTQYKRNTSPLFVGPSGGASLAKPKVEIGQKTTVKTTSANKTTSKKRVVTDEPVKRKDPNIEDAPMYKVMLIGDEEYEQAHLITRITEVMEDIDENRASIVFQQAQQSGKSMCGKYPLEHAELYVEQLLRSDPMIYSELEEENEKKK